MAVVIKDWKRVGDLVRVRRVQLGFKRQEDAADAANVGVTTWRQIENGKQDGYRPNTTGPVSMLLGWPPDMLERIAAGEDPPMEDPAIAKRLEAVEQGQDVIVDTLKVIDGRLDQIERRLEQ